MRRCSGSVTWHLQLVICAFVLPSSSVYHSSTGNAASVIKKLTTYEISGNSPEDLRAQMLEKGPRDIYGIRRYAEVQWKASWRWDKEAEAHNRAINLRVAAEVVLPKWVNREQADPQLQARWDSFTQRLLAHETNHLRNLEQSLPELRLALQSAASKKSATEKEINAAGQRVLRKIRELDREYDRSTLHGKTEGITLD